MDFWIQIGSPRVLSVQDCVYSLPEALQTIFPKDTEDLFIVWNQCPIRLSYRWDLSVVIDDLIYLAEQLSSKEIGRIPFCLASDAIDTSWSLEWNSGQLTINALWRSCPGDLASVRAHCSDLTIPKQAFLVELKSLFVSLDRSVVASGIHIENRSTYDAMRHLIASIEGQRRLYTGR